MSRILSTQDPGVLRTIERTRHINISSPANQPVKVTVGREKIVAKENGDILISEGSGGTARTLDNVFQASEVTLTNGVTITGAEVFEAVALFIEKWVQEDLDEAESALEAKAALEAP